MVRWRFSHHYKCRLHIPPLIIQTDSLSLYIEQNSDTLLRAANIERLLRLTVNGLWHTHYREIMTNTPPPPPARKATVGRWQPCSPRSDESPGRTLLPSPRSTTPVPLDRPEQPPALRSWLHFFILLFWVQIKKERKKKTGIALPIIDKRCLWLL